MTTRQAYRAMVRLAEAFETRFQRHVKSAGPAELLRLDGETTGQSFRRLWPADAKKLEKAIMEWGENAVTERAIGAGDQKYARVEELRKSLLN